MKNTEQSRQQGDRREQCHRNRCSGSNSETGNKPEADGDHSKKRKHHRDAGEYDGAPCGVERTCGCILRGVASPGEFPIAGHHEEGVVDAHAKTDHDADQRREFRN